MSKLVEGMQGEINDMFNTLAGTVNTEDTAIIETVAPTTVAAATTETAPVVDPTAVPVKEPAPVATAVDEIPAATVVDEPSVEDTLRAEIARLSGLVVTAGLNTDTTVVHTPGASSTTTQDSTPPVGTTVSSTPPPATTAAPLEALAQILSGQLLSADELDKVIDQPELLNAAYQRANKSLVENLASVLPQVINVAVEQEIKRNKLVTIFYESNSDLLPHADYVRLVMQEAEKKDPNRTYREIFNETATECRKRLGLKEQPTLVGGQPTATVPKELPPAFAGSRGTQGKTSTPAPKASFDPDLDAMLRV